MSILYVLCMLGDSYIKYDILNFEDIFLFYFCVIKHNSFRRNRKAWDSKPPTFSNAYIIIIIFCYYHYYYYISTRCVFYFYSPNSPSPHTHTQCTDFLRPVNARGEAGAVAVEIGTHSVRLYSVNWRGKKNRELENRLSKPLRFKYLLT